MISKILQFKQKITTNRFFKRQIHYIKIYLKVLLMMSRRKINRFKIKTNNNKTTIKMIKMNEIGHYVCSFKFDLTYNPPNFL